MQNEGPHIVGNERLNAHSLTDICYMLDVRLILSSLTKGDFSSASRKLKTRAALCHEYFLIVSAGTSGLLLHVANKTCKYASPILSDVINAKSHETLPLADTRPAALNLVSRLAMLTI